VPSTLSLLRTLFEDDRERTKPSESGAPASPSAPRSGPLVGGVLLEHFWWAGVSGQIPIMTLLLIAAPSCFQYRDPNAGCGVWCHPVVGSVLAVIYGEATGQDGVAALPLLSIVAGLVLAAVFVRRQRTWPIRWSTSDCSAIPRSTSRWPATC
jgi:DHA2 family multidrug resistance protein-like MFS transporter